MSLLIVTLDNTILNVALPAIARSMHASSSQLQWIVDSYAIVFAGFLLVAGSLGDRLGRKWVLMCGLAVFAAGSAASAFSGSPAHLIASRAFMGIGAAAIMPCTLSILTNVFVEAEVRARAIGIWSGTTGLGVAVGPVAGGWLLAHFWWGSVFLVNVPIAAIGLLAVAGWVPNSRDPESRRPDPVGGVLSVAGLGLLLWGIIAAPTRTWTSPLVLGAVFGAVLVLVGFVWWERWYSDPMLEVSLFRSRRFSVAMGSMAMVIFALIGGLFLLTQYLQFFLGYSALEAGLRVAPIAGVLLIVAPLSPALVRRAGTKVIVCAGMTSIAVGLALMSSVTVHDTYMDTLPSFLLIGMGTGLALAPCTESVMGSLPLQHAGVGAGTNGAALQVGGALGVGVLGSILNSRYQQTLTPALTHYRIPESILHLITGSLGGALIVAQELGGAAGSELAAAARHAFISGMDLAVTVAAVVVGMAAIVAAILLPSRAPDLTGQASEAESGKTDGQIEDPSPISPNQGR